MKNISVSIHVRSQINVQWSLSSPLTETRIIGWVELTQGPCCFPSSPPTYIADATTIVNFSSGVTQESYLKKNWKKIQESEPSFAVIRLRTAYTT